jgi:hypothetical protein
LLSDSFNPYNIIWAGLFLSWWNDAIECLLVICTVWILVLCRLADDILKISLKGLLGGMKNFLWSLYKK